MDIMKKKEKNLNREVEVIFFKSMVILELKKK